MAEADGRSVTLCSSVRHVGSSTTEEGLVIADSERPSLIERLVDRVPFVEKELFLLRRLVQPGDVCIDVGAAGGAHLFVMARRAGRSGHVVGVEPRPGSLRILKALVRAVGFRQRTTLVQAALAEEAGKQELRIPIVPTRAHFHGSSVNRAAAAAFAAMPHRSIEVPTRTLDGLVADLQLERVDVIKCDVEGAELLVLGGAQQVLTEHRPIVIVEADDLHQRRFDATAQDVLDLAAEHGYVAHRYRRGGLERVPSVIADEDDYVLVPSDELAQRAQVAQVA